MGRQAVRSAVASVLQNAVLPHVGTVYAARPVIVQEEDYVATMSGLASESGCVLIVNMPDDKRVRETLTGVGHVEDIDRHQIVVEVFFSYPSDDGVSAQSDYDALIDAIVTLIRNNPTMSAPATVWAAGEYRAGVSHSQSEPFTDDEATTVFIFGDVRFEAWEWVSGTNV